MNRYGSCYYDLSQDRILEGPKASAFPTSLPEIPHYCAEAGTLCIWRLEEEKDGQDGWLDGWTSVVTLRECCFPMIRAGFSVQDGGFFSSLLFYGSVLFWQNAKDLRLISFSSLHT